MSNDCQRSLPFVSLLPAWTGAVLVALSLTTAAQATPAGLLSKADVLQRFGNRSASYSGTEYSSPYRAMLPLSDLQQDAPKLIINSGSYSNYDDVPKVDVDLRKFDSPPKDQGGNGWCTAFATIGVMENKARQLGYALSLSAQHLWSLYQIPQVVPALDAARSNYILEESIWPYDQAERNSYATPGVLQLGTYYSVTDGAQGIQKALQSGNPLVIAVGVTDTFSSDLNLNNGVITTQGTLKGEGHALAIVGIQYADAAPGGGYFVLKNSWGDQGDHGYAYLPFDYCSKFWCSVWELTGLSVDEPAAIQRPAPASLGGIRRITFDNQTGFNITSMWVWPVDQQRPTDMRVVLDLGWFALGDPQDGTKDGLGGQIIPSGTIFPPNLDLSFGCLWNVRYSTHPYGWGSIKTENQMVDFCYLNKLTLLHKA